MKFRWLLLPCVTLAFLGGCNRVGELLGGGGSGGSSSESPAPGGEADPGLAAQVRRDASGVGFRRDLEFPGNVSGNLSIRLEHENVKVVEQSELGKEILNWNHDLETLVTFAKEPGRLRVTLEKAGRWNVLDAEEAEVTQKRSPLEGESIDFVLTEEGWKGSGSGNDFARSLWIETMESQVANLLVETGAHPRAQWFSSSRRWKPGDRVVLTGTAIRLIHPADSSGRVELVFEGEEAVGGHPCGVFALSGKVSVRSEVDLLGQKRDAEITISDGKIWASLLYPVLLHEEYTTVQTAESGEDGGLATRLQGAIRIVKSRSWQAGGD